MGGTPETYQLRLQGDNIWRIGRRQIQLPHFLTPGTAHVIHEDLGHGRFRFSMTIHQRLFGTLFQQRGVFQRQGAPS
jgi:hypothetical protein